MTTMHSNEREGFLSTAKEIITAHTHETRAVGHTDCDACLNADANAIASIVSAQHDAATRMRDACVAKLDSLAKHGTNELVCAALGMAARSLESLTLEAAANSVKDSEGEGDSHGTTRDDIGRS